MEILQNKWECGFTPVAVFAALADGAGGRIEKKSSIVSLAVVVASDAESQRECQDQQCWRERPPAMMGVNERRIKRRNVRPPFVVCPFEGTRCRIKSECAEQGDDGQQLQPPRIPPHCVAEMAPCTSLWSSG